MKPSLCLSLLFLTSLMPTLAHAEADAVAAKKQHGLIGSNYRLQPLDIIQINIFQEPDLSTEARISSDGSVTLQFIGNVTLGGKTVHEATELIKKRYYDEEILTNPQVTINLLSYTERRAYVHGQVLKPGPVVIPPEETMTLSQVISAAGGLSRIADKTIKLTRIDANGKKVVTKHELGDIMAEDPKAKDIVIMDGDTIFVPEDWF